MSEKDNVTLEQAYKDNTFTTMCIDGLSVDEMNEILAHHDSLGKIMTRHGMGGTYSCWHNGYGIYGIRHVGGHLFVQIGNSCD